MDQSQKTQDRTIEEAVSRALRDNLASLQKTAEELQVAFADLVAACGSSRPANVLPSMLRARTAVGALAARLEVLSNFVTAALQPRERPAEEVVLLRSITAGEPGTEPQMPPSSPPVPMAQDVGVAEPPTDTSAEETAPAAWEEPAAEVAEPELAAAEEPIVEEISVEEVAAAEQPGFEVLRLSVEEQELHRRANRVAKVAMQDIQMLRPEDVRLGREHCDLCVRLRGELDKARKEYDRRFHAILDHPIDYFHHWMVEILAGGDSAALGEYPYPSPVLRH
jgi:hypothetical protein